MRSFCEDCKKRCDNVKLRQSDLRLCEQCENIRQGTANKTNQQQRHQSRLVIPTPPNMNESTENPQTLINDHRPTPSNANANAQSLPTCKSNECQDGNQCTEFTQCSLCKEHFHLNCAGLKKAPAKTTKWICTLCKDFPGQMKELRLTVETLLAAHRDILTENVKLRQNVEDLTTRILILENQTSTKVTSEASIVCTKDSIIIEQPSQSLLIGDSMLRDVKESPFPNTTVDCLRGAHISDVEQALKEDPQITTYANIIVHAGTNDIADENPNTIQDLERLITSTQIKAPQAKVFVSSICPRRDRFDAEVTEINKNIETLANTLDCTYVNHEAGFRFIDGSIDSNAYHDKVHLNRKGTGKLVRKLQSAVFKINRKNADTDVLEDQNSEVDFEISPPRSQPRSRRYDNKQFNSKTKSHRFTTQRANRSLSNRNRRSCRKCGETNHSTDKCRYRSPVTCHKCGNDGHKQRYCNKRF